MVFEATMCCATAAKVNDVREKVYYKYREIEIGMSIYMDDFSVAGGPEEVNKEIQKCAKMEVERNMKHSLNKTKFKVVKTGKGKEEEISEQMKTGNIRRTNKRQQTRK